MVKYQPLLPLRVMSGSLAIQWMGLGSMSMAPITTREHRDIPGLRSCQETGGCPELDLLPFAGYGSTWEYGPGSSPGQHIRVGISGAWKALVWETYSVTSLP